MINRFDTFYYRPPGIYRPLCPHFQQLHPQNVANIVLGVNHTKMSSYISTHQTLQRSWCYMSTDFIWRSDLENVWSGQSRRRDGQSRTWLRFVRHTIGWQRGWRLVRWQMMDLRKERNLWIFGLRLLRLVLSFLLIQTRDTGGNKVSYDHWPFISYYRKAVR